MQVNVKQSKPTFKPTDLTITFNSQKELDCFITSMSDIADGCHDTIEEFDKQARQIYYALSDIKN